MYRIYIALNMLLASLIPGALARETISGRVGRSWPNSWISRRIDALFPGEEAHCVDTARKEVAARKELGYISR